MRYRRAIKYARQAISYFTLKKLVNYARYRNDLRRRPLITSSFPPQITFEASAYCNSNCRLCPVGLKIDGSPKGFLRFDTFKKAVDEAKNYLIRLDFADWGEPLLNPDIFDMIQYAEKRRIMAALSTNLHAVKNEEDLKRIVNSGLSFVTISLHGVSQESYEAYQPGMDFRQTVDKIQNLVNFKRSLRRVKPIIDVVFAITKKNQHEVRKMSQFAKDMGVDSIIYTASLNLRFYLGDPHKLSEVINEWAQIEPLGLSDNVAFRKEGAMALYRAVLGGKVSFEELDKLRLTGRHVCLDPWRYLVVNWDGTVSLCCVDYRKYVVGDTHTESIIGIWNNKRYQAVRNYLRKVSADDSEIPCKRCIMY
jgi:radical SAM protein with 4Fe4S-binding SPASM domain